MVVMLAWLAHLYTASGGVFALLATMAVFERDYRAAFLWLAAQVLVDATDGWFARRVRVSERVPWFNGAKLDDIIDYLTYVFVPALIVWHAPLVHQAWAAPVGAAMLLSSAYGFNRADAKTADHFYTGFPSYWNIVVFYLFVASLPREANAVILIGLAVLVFVPIQYVYPSRTPVLRGMTVALGLLWGVLMFVMVWGLPVVSRPVLIASLVFPVYYTGLSLVLHFRAGGIGVRRSG
jgi:phosphatidylcholine synthase